jgi:hypothetical protein
MPLSNRTLAEHLAVAQLAVDVATASLRAVGHCHAGLFATIHRARQQVDIVCCLLRYESQPTWTLSAEGHLGCCTSL